MSDLALSGRESGFKPFLPTWRFSIICSKHLICFMATATLRKIAFLSAPSLIFLRVTDWKRFNLSLRNVVRGPSVADRHGDGTSFSLVHFEGKRRPLAFPLNGNLLCQSDLLGLGEGAWLMDNEDFLCCGHFQFSVLTQFAPNKREKIQRSLLFVYTRTLLLIEVHDLGIGIIIKEEVPNGQYLCFFVFFIT